MVFSRRPKFFLEGWHGRITKEEVPALAAMLNNEWYVDYSLVREIKLCIRDCIKTGWGILLTSYDAEFDAKTQRDKAIAQAEEAVTNPLLFMAEATQGQMLPEGLQPQEYQETFQGDSRVIMDAINSRRTPNGWVVWSGPMSRRFRLTRRLTTGKSCIRTRLAPRRGAISVPTRTSGTTTISCSSTRSSSAFQAAAGRWSSSPRTTGSS